jgi:hypothetical protein
MGVGVHLMGVGVHLMGVYLTGVHLPGHFGGNIVEQQLLPLKYSYSPPAGVTQE